jgi:uncharacterized protein (TIGR02594 family)
MAIEPTWYREAKKWIGLREYPGARHNPTIMAWAKRLGSRILGINVKDDETPWCGLFMAHCFDSVGILPPAIAIRASEWGKWGRELTAPRLGCVLVFTRQGGGHVGLYVGEDDTSYHVLGGNQSNSVSIMRLAKNRLTSMRWPTGVTLPAAKVIKRDPGNLTLSRNEG